MFVGRIYVLVLASKLNTGDIKHSYNRHPCPITLKDGRENSPFSMMPWLYQVTSQF